MSNSVRENLKYDIYVSETKFNQGQEIARLINRLNAINQNDMKISRNELSEWWTNVEKVIEAIRLWRDSISIEFTGQVNYQDKHNASFPVVVDPFIIDDDIPF